MRAAPTGQLELERDRLLTDDERLSFERDGFLRLPGALDAAALERFRTIAERYDAAYRAEPGISRYHVLNLHDLIGRDDAFLELLDHPATFHKVWGVLGWNIQLFHTQLVVTPPAPAGASGGGYGWHQDNNRMNRDFETDVHPRVSVKVAYFLSDLPTTGMGNFCLVPGSHRDRRLRLIEGQSQPDGALEVTASAGDALLFDRRLWHAASTNTATRPRIALFYGYSYRWLRPKSAMNLADLVDRVDPIRGQLLGRATSANGYFDPEDDDVPLRRWIEEHVGAHAVVA